MARQLELEQRSLSWAGGITPPSTLKQGAFSVGSLSKGMDQVKSPDGPVGEVPQSLPSFRDAFRGWCPAESVPSHPHSSRRTECTASVVGRRMRRAGALCMARHSCMTSRQQAHGVLGRICACAVAYEMRLSLASLVKCGLFVMSRRRSEMLC